MLQVDYDERRARRVEIGEGVLRAAAFDDALYNRVGMVVPLRRIGIPQSDQVGVGASGWSSLASRKSAHSAVGIG